MPLIRSPIWNDPRVKPPYGAVEIDWSHPLAWGLTAALLYNEGGQMLVDSVTRFRAYPSRVGFSAWRPSRFGPSLAGFGVGDFSRTDWNFGGGAWPSTPPISFFFIARVVPAAAEAEGACWFCEIGGVGQADVVASAYLNTWSLSRPGVWGDNSPFTFTAGWHAVGIRSNSTGGGTAYFYDRDYTAGTVQSAAIGKYNAPANTGGTCQVALRSRAVDDTNVDQFGVMYYWSGRLLSDAEVAWLSDEPYLFFRPIVRRRWFVPAAGTPVSAAVAPSWEAAGGVAVSGVAAWEALAGVRTSSTTAYEGLAAATRATGSPWEALAGLRPSTAVPWEAGGVAETPVSSAVASPWEALSATSRTSPMPWESLVRVSVPTAASWEALVAVGPARSAGWEALAGTSAAPTTSWEAVRTVSAAVGVSWEATGAPVTRAIAVPWEAEGGAAPVIRSRRLMVGVGR